MGIECCDCGASVLLSISFRTLDGAFVLGLEDTRCCDAWDWDWSSQAPLGVCSLIANYLSTRIPMAARPHSFRHSICSLYFLGGHTLRKPDRESKWLVSSKKGVGPAIPCV